MTKSTQYMYTQIHISYTNIRTHTLTSCTHTYNYRHIDKHLLVPWTYRYMHIPTHCNIWVCADKKKKNRLSCCYNDVYVSFFDLLYLFFTMTQSVPPMFKNKTLFLISIDILFENHWCLDPVGPIFRDSKGTLDGMIGNKTHV